jgi:hypothetical protein
MISTDDDELFSATKLRQELQLEVMRLNALAERFYSKAMADDDVASGTLYCKLSERKSTLLGLAAPQSHAVQVILQKEQPKRLTSTQQALEVLNRVREEGRQKHPEEYAEIEAVRAKYRRLRGEPDLPALDSNEPSEPNED